MPITPRSPRPFLITLLGVVLVAGVAGCATERLAGAAPNGINLSGEWKFNPNLSDDPDKLVDPSKPTRSPSSEGQHSGRGGRGGVGGSPPYGGGPNFLGTGSPGGTLPDISAADFAGGLPSTLTAMGLEGSAPILLADNTPANSPPAGRSKLSQLLQAPAYLSIQQKGTTIAIKANMPDGTATSDEVAAGTTTNVPSDDDTVERTAGWRGPVFVITTNSKKNGSREVDYAIDEDDGRLIVSILMKGGHLGKHDFKRVYDRIKT
jgi:hypothetical protein